MAFNLGITEAAAIKALGKMQRCRVCNLAKKARLRFPTHNIPFFKLSNSLGSLCSILFGSLKEIERKIVGKV